MPIYEYRCESCSHTLEALQKLTDGPLTDCPECGRPALRRLISAPAFRLKGGGWYETDFKSDKEKKRNLAESSGTATEKSGKSDKGGTPEVAADKGKDKKARKSAGSVTPEPA